MLITVIQIVASLSGQPAIDKPCIAGPSTCLDAFYKTFPENLSEQEKSDQAAKYADSYLNGLLGIGWSNNYSGSNKGILDGREFRKRYPEKLAQSLSLFGYRYIEFNGSLSRGFEYSHIASRKEKIKGFDGTWWWSRFDADRGWWYGDTLGFADALPSKQSEIVIDCKDAEIKGYLSPRGNYGHMAVYFHKLVVTEFNCRQP